MALFVAVLEGNTPESAKPLFASGDERLIAALARELLLRINSKLDADCLEPILKVPSSKGQGNRGRE